MFTPSTGLELCANTNVVSYKSNNDIKGKLMKKSRPESGTNKPFEKLLESFTLRFVSTSYETLNQDIELALKEIAGYINADRAYVFLFDETGLAMNNTHEWCAPFIEPQKDKLQAQPVDIFPWWMERLRNKQLVNIPNIADLPPEAKNEHDILEMQSIKSVLVAPIEMHNKLIGFTGFDAVKNARSWSKEALFLVKLLSEIIGKTLILADAQRELGDSETNFKRFFESITDFLIVADLSGHIIYANKELTAKSGYSLEELLRMHVLDLHLKKDRQEAEKILVDMMSKKREYCPLPLGTKEGAIIPVETRIWPGKWNGNDCIFGISKDLTPQHEALQLFERLFLQSPFPVALTAVENNRITRVNDAFLNKLGYSKDEVIGKTNSELNLFLNPDQQTIAASEILRCGHISDQRLEVRKKDGTIITGLFSGELITNQGETYFLTIMVDITDIVKLEVALRKSELELKEAQLMAKVGRWDYDHHENKLTWGESIYDILELERDRFEGTFQDFLDIVHPDDREIVNRAWMISLENKKPYAVEHRLFRKDGSTKWVNVNCKTEFDPSGRPLHSIGTVQDLTERKEYEIALINSKYQIEALNNQLKERLVEIERTNQAKSNFLSNVSHELRTPLTAIIGLSELLQKQYYGTLNDKQSEYVADVLMSSRHLLNLINEILDLTKIESGKTILEILEVPVKELIESSLLLVRENAAANKIRLQLEIPQAMTVLKVPVDKQRLIQVMVNLLSNAVKFTQPGGRVIVKAEKLQDDLRVSITDTGIGISREHQEKIFEPFYQIQTKNKSKTPGTGLGLSISREIIELHGGSIWVESDGSNGSRFSFTIPLKKVKRDGNSQ